MLLVYGSNMPLRWLEEIRFWKMQEKEHTEVIRAIAPDLEPQYVNLMREWEPIFEQTEQCAAAWMDQLIPHSGALPPQGLAQVDSLLHLAAQQSQCFIAQLHLLMRHSAAVIASPLAQTVILHIIRESEYFLCVLNSLHTHPTAGAATPPRVEFNDGNHFIANHSMANGFTANSSTASMTNIPMTNNSMANGFTANISAGNTSRTNTSLPNTQASSLLSEQLPEHRRSERQSVPIGGHTLPPLPYDYNALEPYIDEQTMRIHHDIHHKSYVDGLNKAEEALRQARKTGNFDLVKHWERELAFNGAGHYLHTLFWNVMSPQGGGPATGAIAEQIKQDFGSYDAFQKQFSQAAEKVEGGGWAILVWSPRSRRLEILQAEKHQNLSQWDVVPLLPLDVWEHAYYLKHQNKRGDYIKDWWNVVNWPYVNERFAEARQLQWEPF
ncbi:DUF2935 domain-containing protein [Paenibacillaceae bacterium]|nr:DUF2935 domain-containing protein [Paenibacillaceae bacterium]